MKEGLYGFGGMSGLSPCHSTDTRIATPHRPSFVVNNKDREMLIGGPHAFYVSSETIRKIRRIL